MSSLLRYESDDSDNEALGSLPVSRAQSQRSLPPSLPGGSMSSRPPVSPAATSSSQKKFFGKEVDTQSVFISSKYRDYTKNPYSTSYTVPLPKTYKNVLSLGVKGTRVINGVYPFSTTNRNRMFGIQLSGSYVQEDVLFGYKTRNNEVLCMPYTGTAASIAAQGKTVITIDQTDCKVLIATSNVNTSQVKGYVVFQYHGQYYTPISGLMHDSYSGPDTFFPTTLIDVPVTNPLLPQETGNDATFILTPLCAVAKKYGSMPQSSTEPIPFTLLFYLLETSWNDITQSTVTRNAVDQLQRDQYVLDTYDVSTTIERNIEERSANLVLYRVSLGSRVYGLTGVVPRIMYANTSYTYYKLFRHTYNSQNTGSHITWNVSPTGQIKPSAFVIRDRDAIKHVVEIPEGFYTVTTLASIIQTQMNQVLQENDSIGASFAARLPGGDIMTMVFNGSLIRYTIALNASSVIPDDLEFKLFFTQDVAPFSSINEFGFLSRYESWGLGYNLGYEKDDYTSPGQRSVTTTRLVTTRTNNIFYVRINDLPVYDVNVSRDASEDNDAVAENNFKKQSATTIIRLNGYREQTTINYSRPYKFQPVLGQLSQIQITFLDEYFEPILDRDTENFFNLEISSIVGTTKNDASLDIAV